MFDVDYQLEIEHWKNKAFEMRQEINVKDTIIQKMKNMSVEQERLISDIKKLIKQNTQGDISFEDLM